jgi:hypothetical protein
MSGPRFALAILGLVLAGGLVARTGSAASLSVSSQGFTPYRTCTLTGSTATATTVIDASVRQASATTNFGTSTTNDIASQSAANRRLYVRFDLSLCSPAIPSSATIRLATLRLFATVLPAAVCRTVDVFRVTSTWTEAAITWNSQPFGTTINNPASGSRADSFNVGTLAGCQNLGANAYIVGADLTAEVAAFVAGTATNFGWMLRDDAEGNATALTFTSSGKNLGTASQGPQLVITYVTVP